MVAAPALIAALSIAAHAAEIAPGVQIASQVVYASMPDRPHALEATYSGSTRARLWIGIDAATGRKGATYFKSGDLVCEWDPKARKSRELAGDERRSLLRSLELRRAVFLWPDGFAWTSAVGARTAHIDTLGSLRAEFAKPGDARPREIAALDAAGTVVESIRIGAWREENGRAWPAHLELWQAGALFWTEDVRAIDPKAQWIDSAFLPPDRREATRDPPAPLVIQERDLPTYCGRRFALPARCDYAAALDAEARERAAWTEKLKPLGLELEPRVTIVLSEHAAPEAFVLRLAKAAPNPPEGFVVTAATKGVATSLASLDEVDEQRVGELRARVPAGAKTGAAYLRLPFGERPPRQLLLVVPLTGKGG